MIKRWVFRELPQRVKGGVRTGENIDDETGENSDKEGVVCLKAW